MENHIDLEQFKNLASLLSPGERVQLWGYLAELPDSGIHNLNEPPPSSDGPAQQSEVTVDGDHYDLLFTPTDASLVLKGRVVLQVFFYPDHFRKSRMEIHSWKDAPPSEEVKQQIQEIFRLHGDPERDEPDLIAAVKQSQKEVFEATTVRIAKELSARLPHMAWLLLDAGIKIVEIAAANDFADHSGQRKRTLDEIIKILEPYWKHLKAHLNLSPGGRQNIKHQWTIRDHTCLAVHYDRLKPIWREAKKAAKQALTAKESSRRKNWKDQVAAAYKEEELPVDLVEQLALTINAQPAELALIHAARICLPNVSYSTRVLKQKLKQFNPVSRTSSKTTTNKGTS